MCLHAAQGVDWISSGAQVEVAFWLWIGYGPSRLICMHATQPQVDLTLFHVPVLYPIPQLDLHWRRLMRCETDVKSSQPAGL